MARRIGLLVESLSDRFWHEIVLAVDAAARRAGVQLLVFVGGTLDAPEIAARQANRCYQLASGACLDGLIVAPLGSAADPARLARYFERYRPLPLSALTTVLGHIPGACTDNVRSTREAVSHLIEAHGAERVAFIRGPRVNPEAELRYRGYREALQAHALREEPGLVLDGDFSEESGTRAIEALDLAGTAPFDALVAANDSMALGALAELARRGVRVPDRLRVMGFDDVPEGRWGAPSLSTVRQSLPRLAEAALGAVLGQLAGEPVAASTLIPGELMLRETCWCRATFQASADAGDPSSEEPSGQNGEQPSQPLRQALRELVDQGGELADWQAAVSRWRRLAMAAGQPVIEDEVYDCRAGLGSVAERRQASHRIRSELWLRETIAAGSDVLGNFSREGMLDALAGHLPSLMVQNCLLVLHEPEPEFPPARSRVVFAQREGQRVPLPSEGLVFATRELAPEALLPVRPATLSVLPLYFGDETLGTLLFELGAPLGQVHDWLREQVSVALAGARLLARIEREVSERQHAERKRLAHELELAARIQASVLPRNLEVAGLDIAASMLPASEVGGDCYDVLAFSGGAWLSIGDVAGHGLGPGVVMMMIQSSVAAILEADAAIRPRQALACVNAVIFDTVKRRLKQGEHATLLLLRYEVSGALRYAGAHEEPLIWRAESGRCERLPAPGVWIGIKPIEADQLPESEQTLAPGDVLLLYTDGAVEAMNAEREQFGVERLARELERVAREPVSAIRDHLLSCVREWMERQRDDITLLVARYLGSPP